MKTSYIFSKTTQINNGLRQQCDSLYDECCIFDKLNHPCFFEDEFDIFTDSPRLYYVSFQDRLLGFLSTYIIDAYSVEICLFVHPGYRGQKIGSRLLNYFFNDYKIPNIDVSIHPENRQGIDFLRQHHFHLMSTELLMNIALENFIPKNFYIPKLKRDFSSNTFKYMIHDECVGSCSISFLSDTRICISDVEIFEEHRNKGIGYQFMREVLREMSLYFHSAFLHVTKENIPAYNLYKKLGFQEIDSTLVYKK